MKYLTPIETLESSISRYHKLTIALIAALALTITVIPFAMRRSNPVLVRAEKGIVLSDVEPWKLSIARTEQFARAYLSNRFEWSESDFDQRRMTLSRLASPTVLSRLKDSVQAFESIAHNQKARSYYVVEGFQFVNEDRKINAAVTRVLRIQNAALATPLNIEIGYTEAPISPENPYGMVVTNVNESEISSR